MKIAVAVTGASGAIYAQLFLRDLQQHLESGNVREVGLVWSSNAHTVWEEELANKDYSQIPFKTYDRTDYYAPFASGSAGYDALVIVPCSMGTLGRIASGMSDNLISRAADVMLKERKKLICVVRETPYNLIHLQNMKIVTEAGGIICPGSPSFYSRPQNIEEACQTVVDRIYNLLGLDNKGYKWG